MLKSQWEQWRRKVRNRNITIDLVYEDFKDTESSFGEHYIVFVLRHEGLQFPFMLGIDDKDTLNSEFMADYSGNCDTPIYCEWIKQMGYFIGGEYDNPDSLIRILDEAIRLYQHLVKNPKEYATTRLITKNRPRSNLKILNDIGNIHRVRVEPITNEKWNIQVEARHGFITAYVRTMSSSTGFYCEMRILSPRLAIGRNVNFGGSVSATGLVKASPSPSIRKLVERILEVLDDEVPLPGTTDYSDEEYEDSIAKTTVVADYVGKWTIQLSGLPIQDNSAAVISGRKYDDLIGDSEYLWLKLHNVTLEKDI